MGAHNTAPSHQWGLLKNSSIGPREKVGLINVTGMTELVLPRRRGFLFSWASQTLPLTPITTSTPGLPAHTPAAVCPKHSRAGLTSLASWHASPSMHMMHTAHVTTCSDQLCLTTAGD